MQNRTLEKDQFVDVVGDVEVKVRNGFVTHGKVRVECPNVPVIEHPVPSKGEKNIRIPVGTSRFTNIGTPDLDLSW